MMRAQAGIDQKPAGLGRADAARQGTEILGDSRFSRGFASGGPEAHARDFRAADTQVEDYPTVQALMAMDQIVNERTRGRHRIRVFHSRQLGEEKETIEQTRAGAIDLNRTNVAPLGSFVPEANVLALPFLFRSMEHLLQCARRADR